MAKLGTKNQLERDAIFVLTDCALQAKQRLNHLMIWNFLSRIFNNKLSSLVAQNIYPLEILSVFSERLLFKHFDKIISNAKYMQ